MAATKISVKSLQAQIELRKNAIADQRDKLRALVSDVEDICAEADEAVQCLEQAVDALSKYL